MSSRATPGSRPAAATPTSRTRDDLEELYGEFTGQLKTFRDQKGLSAAVYTQITDVETELNGLMTYDRMLKCDPAQIALANHFQYPVPTYREIVPTSEKTSQTWKYTITAPAADWYQTSLRRRGLADRARAASARRTRPASAVIGTAWTHRRHLAAPHVQPRHA